MASKDLLLKPPTLRERKHRRQAIAISILLHGLVVGLVSALAIFYHQEIKIRGGSPPGMPTITLSTLVVSSPPPAPPAPPTPTPPTPTPPLPEPTPVVATPPPVPEPRPIPPENALPVLPPVLAPAPPAPTIAKKDHPTHPHTASHPVASTSDSLATSHTEEKESVASSYAPGASDLPHPPYPDEARSLGKTGTVVLNVQFDGQGSVTSAEIVQSSGVSILDTSTRAFIRTHWHSQAYAGQLISVPVRYRLQDL